MELVTEALIKGTAEHDEIVSWRKFLHSRPELAFDEYATSDFVYNTLKSFGLSPERGFGKTGVVATIEGKWPGDSIGLRADMDALPIQESNRFPHASKHKGCMHACGHDGHTAMLLGAAKQLSKTRYFKGKVHVVFQPAEELGKGAIQMIDSGLFERFPMKEIYGMHNWPGLDVGKFAVHNGAVMAASEPFSIVIEGVGGHAAIPDQVRDPLYAGVQIVSALQSVVSRNVSPLDSAVLSVTKFNAGENHNVIPKITVIEGTIRYLTTEIGNLLHERMNSIISNIGLALGVTTSLSFSSCGTPPVVNSENESLRCFKAATAVVGDSNVLTEIPPSLGGEDFSYFLENIPGAYIWAGNGAKELGKGLHNANYDFNDEIIPYGVNYWVSLVELRLHM